LPARRKIDRGSFPGVNSPFKVRDAAGSAKDKMRSGAAKVGRAPRRAWEGTTRTTGWVRDGAGRGWKRTRAGVAGATGDAREWVRDSAEAAWDRSGGARIAEGARSSPRVAIAWAVAALLLVAWIAWAVYVAAENGANAGLGVLLSWPAVFAALALVAAPFVAAVMLVQRLRNGDRPSLAGEPDGSDSDAVTSGTYPG
jgi:hypothetical protein